MMNHSRLTLSAILVTAAGSFAACGGGGDTGSTTGSGGSAGTAGTASTSPTAAGGASGSSTGEEEITVGSGGSASTGSGGGDNCDGVLPKDNLDRIIHDVMNLENVTNVTALVRQTGRPLER